MNFPVKLSSSESGGKRADRQIALLFFALALAVYWRGAAPDMLGGDSGEFQFAAWKWGLAHPTGYPLYLLSGGLWQRLLALLGIAPALALNLFSGLTAASAVGLFYLLMRRWLTGDDVLARLAAAWAAFMLAVNPTFWSQALLAEVYALHALFIVLIFLAAQALSDGPEGTGEIGLRPIALLAFLVGLSLTHHGMTLFLAPGLLIYLTLLDRGWWRNPRTWATALPALLGPLLLYLYIPLRSGPVASPWYHQRLGEGVLTLYAGGSQAFWDFITGRAISVGFYSWAEAWQQLGQAGTLWRIHFNWPGMVLVIVGLIWLVRQRNWPLLALTAPYFVLQQTFNLFYAIGDILVYYIPLYLVAAIWAGCGAYGLATGLGERTEQAPGDEENGAALRFLGAVLLIVLMWLPLRLWSNYSDVLDQRANRQARAEWEDILAAQPPEDAILISNDRNEIAPLFYLQAVEGRARGMTGLFPLIAPDPRFADVARTIETGLDVGGEQPVVLIKPMPGLEAKFNLEPGPEPLVYVRGLAGENVTPAVVVNERYGPLTLLGYDLTLGHGQTTLVTLYWQVGEVTDGPADRPIAGDYTTTVQFLDAAGDKLAQDDHPPGGVYYPTSLWRPGDVLADQHELALEEGSAPAATMLIDMYAGPDFTPLAEPLRLDLAPDAP